MAKIPSKSKPTPPLQFLNDTVAWAAWLYYVENETQEGAAKKLGVSRASVANYISEAKERGLVNIQVNADILSTGQLAERLKAHFSLDDVFVSPESPTGQGDQNEQQQRIAFNGGRILQQLLQDGQTLGVAWGRTMMALGASLSAQTKRQHMSDVTVMQIAGSMLNDKNSSPEFCTALIANAFNAKSLNFNAPSIVSNTDLRQLLLQEPALQAYMQKMCECDMAAFGVGAFDEAKDFGDVFLSDADLLKYYAHKGAVGVLMGHFINGQGDPIVGPLQDRQIGISLDELKRIPKRLMVGAGGYKVGAISAALRGAFCTHLVTDLTTAQELINSIEQGK